MKILNRFKLIILFFTAFVFLQEGYAQNNSDPGIGLSMNPPSVSQGSTGILEATVGNYGNDSIVENSLRVTISVSNNAEIIAVDPASDMRWSQLSLTPGSANTISLTNSNGSFNSFDIGNIKLIVSGNMESGPELILGNIVYITAQNPALCGGCASPPLNTFQGNAIGGLSIEDIDNSNDNSTTSLAVTCDQQDETVFVDSCVESEAGEVVTTEFTADSCAYELTTITTYIGQSGITVNDSTCVQSEAGTVVTTEFTTDSCAYELTTITAWIGTSDQIVNIESCIESEQGTVVTTETNLNGCEYQVTTITTWIGQFGPTLVGEYPADADHTCSEPCPVAPILEFTDPIDSDLVVTFTETTVEFGCGDEVTRTWIATNFCGNSDTVVQVLTSYDNVPPVVQFATPDMTISCSDDIPEIEVVFVDNCDEELTVVVNTQILGDPCNNQIIKTCTATDDCGNSVSSTTVITIVDSTPPILVGVPEDMTLECGYGVPHAIVMATDNCDDDLVVALTAVTNEIDCGYELIRTWSTTDNCGNEASESQSITVVDSIAPVFDLYEVNIEMPCDQIDDAVLVSATDDCGESTITFEDQFALGGCAGVIIRDYTATDECGNQSYAQQIISLTDTTAPTISGEDEEETVECSDFFIVPEDYEVNDNCDDNLTIDYTDEVIAGSCGGERTQIFSCTATDNCGNSTTRTFTVHYVDVSAPWIYQEIQGGDYSCDEGLPADEPTWYEGCSGLTVSFDDSIVEGDCPQSYTVLRTWIATDDCGYSSLPYTVEYNVYDDEAPVFNFVPVDLTVECDALIPSDDATATDNCGQVIITSQDVVSTGDNSCISDNVITRTWTAVDECGNEATASQVITVVDTTMPFVVTSVPAEITLQSDQPEPTEVPTFDDNCDDDLDISAISGISNVTDCGWDVEKSWTATDDCGNTTTVSQIIQFIDSEAPLLIGVPADSTVQCDAVPLAANVTATDGGDIEFTEVITPGEPAMVGHPPCGWTVERTWRATDLCGNTTVATQTITVVDTTAPDLIGVPADVTVDCNSIPEPADVTAVDNCDEFALVIVLEENILPLDCGYQLIRTWVVEDNCWNYNSESQVITVTDTADPVLSGVPENVTVECDAIPDPAEVTASDNCTTSFIPVSLVENTFPVDCGYALIRYWTAHDNCGNTVTESQVITVTDTTAPELNGAPEDMTVDCADIPAAEVLEATDNCGDVEVIFTEEATGTCDYDIIRIWRAIDACGNSDIHTQTIHVTDTTVPDFGFYDVEVSLSCEDFSSYEIEVSDGCGNSELTYEDTYFSGGCFGQIQRTWTATTPCGYSSTALQFIQLYDETSPEIFNVPEDLTVQCGQDVPEIETSVSATDNCDDDVEISFSQEITNEFCPYVITRTWTATDDCGNFIEGTQVITIEVDTPEQVSIFSYPNPFNDSFTVNFSVPKNAAVNAKVVDGVGRTVSVVFDGQADGARLYEYTLSGLDWAPGSYTLMMVVGGEVHHHMLMVQND